VNVKDCVRITIDNEPNVENRVLAIVRNRAEPLFFSDFEHEYTNRYNLQLQAKSNSTVYRKKL